MPLCILALACLAPTAAANDGAGLADGPATAKPAHPAANGGAPYGTPLPTGGPTVPGTRAKLVGKVAYAPSLAPYAVQKAVWAANRLRSKPYIYGGGHSLSWKLQPGYDCSGTVSFALHGAGLIKTPMDSSQFMVWGKRGKGKWITVFANSGHAYAIIAGLRLDTSGPGQSGPRWRATTRSNAGYVVRHPRGF
ncbi:MAG TPA: hypothetical protein VGI54_02595 [Solirubrobacteraceae bacterium]